MLPQVKYTWTCKNPKCGEGGFLSEDLHFARCPKCGDEIEVQPIVKGGPEAGLIKKYKRC